MSSAVFCLILIFFSPSDLVMSAAFEAERNKCQSLETGEPDLAVPNYAPTEAVLQVRMSTVKHKKCVCISMCMLVHVCI